ncbi:Holliday junction resolvase RecU [Mycoplasma sp. 2634B]|uniref:Holliday junction resolvase RecU n=1 Tax=unclassified Mycoplasma TaxID=2683645 RepID=UPI003AAEC583
MNNKNRGMFLETIINQTLAYYWKEEIAFIEKKATPIEVKTLAHRERNNYQGSFNLKKSTVDYIGMYNGRFICFEAKSTNENRLDLNNFQQHQLNYLNLIDQHNGIAFVIVYFSLYNEFYLVQITYILHCYEVQKSIPYIELKKNSRRLDLEFPGHLNILY